MFTFDAFFDHIGDADWLGIIVATIATMILSWLWYAPLFGKAWASATGQAAGDMDPRKIATTGITLLVFNFGLSFFAFDDIEHALVMGLIFGVLLIAMAMYAGVVWTSYSARAYLIDATYWVAVVIVGAFVQGLML
jgi:hypothetical protein